MTTPAIRWKLALKSPPERVYEAVATDAGRRAFWALEADASGGAVHFVFPNGQRDVSRIDAAEPPWRFEITYFGARTVFDIEPAGKGAVLSLRAENVPAAEWSDVNAGWVAVLMALKAYVDFGIDLRNGDPERSWDAGFVDQ